MSALPATAPAQHQCANANFSARPQPVRRRPVRQQLGRRFPFASLPADGLTDHQLQLPTRSTLFRNINFGGGSLTIIISVWPTSGPRQ
jgi:hypothetical protein